MTFEWNGSDNGYLDYSQRALEPTNIIKNKIGIQLGCKLCVLIFKMYFENSRFRKSYANGAASWHYRNSWISFDSENRTFPSIPHLDEPGTELDRLLCIPNMTKSAVLKTEI